MKFQGFVGWIEIFKGGKQTDSNGRTHDGEKIIEKALVSFDAKAFEPRLS